MKNDRLDKFDYRWPVAIWLSLVMAMLVGCGGPLELDCATDTECEEIYGTDEADIASLGGPVEIDAKVLWHAR